MAEAPILEARSLHVAYGDAPALWDISLRVEKGEIVSVLGTNGAGKTTLVNTIARLLPIKKGQLDFDGAEVTGLAAQAMCDRGVALIPEGHRLFVKLTVEENAKLVEPGYDMAPPEAQADLRAEVQAALALAPTHGGDKWKSLLKIRDSIADITLQQVLTRAKDFEVIATTNLNGDYLSDALAAQVGGIGIAPGGNINYDTGHAVFEATHGTAPKYANLDRVNPGSVTLSGEMMLRHLGWNEAADLVIKGMDGAIGAKTVTYDFARLMEGAKEVKCSEFAKAVIEHM